MAAKKVLAEIKQDLDACVGKKIRLRANRGRKKVVERIGVLEQTYPHIFVVKLDEKRCEARRVSFSYIDILTEEVELSLCSEEEERRVAEAGK
ncbi:Veg protein [Clostridiales bacterium PH28_bin88]|nr:Veg protein [Clostridiales bacterium PH28_bin88]